MSILIANWKMNPDSLNKAELLFAQEIKNNTKHQIIICPPHIWLESLYKKYKKYIQKNIGLGCQNINHEENGAHTGEVSIKMIKDSGCKYIIIGHSERRATGETQEIINQKIQLTLKHKLTPILCIGEPMVIKQQGLQSVKNYLETQLIECLKNISLADKKQKIFIAYEPIWAIGNFAIQHLNQTEILEIKQSIELTLQNLFSTLNIHKTFKILYGGSVDEKNIKTFVGNNLMDGSLIGTSSLNPKTFQTICKQIN